MSHHHKVANTLQHLICVNCGLTQSHTACQDESVSVKEEAVDLLGRHIGVLHMCDASHSDNH